MSYLLDTNVLSELRKRRPNAGVRAWFAGVGGGELYLSVLVIGEIRQGVERLRRRDPQQAAGFDRWLATLERDYADRILPITPEIADTWGRINVPEPLPAIDGLLAATALVHDLTLVTRNTADLRRSGARLLDPFGER